MGHRFSLTSAHSAQRGFCCVINMKSHMICSQSLFLGATYQDSVHHFKSPFAIHCQVISQSITSFSLTYCPCILFCFLSFSFSFALYSFGSTASEMLTTLLSPIFLSNASSLLSHASSNYSFLSSRSSHN